MSVIVLPDTCEPAAIIPQPALSAAPASYDPLDLVAYPEVLPVSMPCEAFTRRAPRVTPRRFLPIGWRSLPGELSATVARLRARDAQVLAFSQPTGGQGGPDPLEPRHERPIGYYARRVEVALLGIAALFFVAQMLRAYLAGML
ncbi:hypothetical protein SAMN05192583_1409 [Sphingomonas gellani]|uniref:Uncharacterized protein n=1 Tax=Sphingomonas gellani TaxID=1166340 RepID=A0A1H8C170_9SPHN|nr:hypothetical protein [Sphingomonas gellani]SEM88742.1 hypothetical protein SAMN05192583_1409 [Sphingomonas gellani]